MNTIWLSTSYMEISERGRREQPKKGLRYSMRCFLWRLEGREKDLGSYQGSTGKTTTVKLRRKEISSLGTLHLENRFRAWRAERANGRQRLSDGERERLNPALENIHTHTICAESTMSTEATNSRWN